jgi:ABC-2 type transport system ATP-binding protein
VSASVVDPREARERPPTIEAREARIAVDGVVAVESLTLTTTGDRVVFAGDAGALFAALSGVPRSAGGGGRVPAAGGTGDGEMPGEAYVVAGSLLLAGKSVAEGAHVAVSGAAPLDPPLPPQWTVEEYVGWGARLAGASRGDARALCAAALGRTSLAAAKRKTIGGLSLPERRALVVAQAIASGPEVLVAEAPLRGLEGQAAAFVLQAIASASEGRRSAISVARLDAGCAEGALARGASHLVVLAGGEVALEGPPGELFAGARVYALTVRSNAEPLRAELSARGIDLRGGPVRFSAALPAGLGSRDILEAARAARAAVVEMVPVIG